MAARRSTSRRWPASPSPAPAWPARSTAAARLTTGPSSATRGAFGDGATATGATASHTYAADGTYNVTLTVTDDAGQTDSITQAVTVSEGVVDQPPVADFTSPAPGSPAASTAAARRTMGPSSATSGTWRRRDRNRLHRQPHLRGGRHLHRDPNGDRQRRPDRYAQPAGDRGQPGAGGKLHLRLHRTGLHLRRQRLHRRGRHHHHLCMGLRRRRDRTGVTANHTYAAAGTYA